LISGHVRQHGTLWFCGVLLRLPGEKEPTIS
jgi:hypothetical protein